MTRFLNFTKATIDGLQVHTKRFEVADTKTPGLRLRVNSNGTKTYFLYRKVNGKPQRINIGRQSDLTIEQARKEAMRLNSEITLGGDPIQERKNDRSEPTFKDLFQLYYDQYALLQTKRPEDNKKTIEYHIFPAFGDHKISTITPSLIQRHHIKIGISHRSTANRVMHIVSAVFNFGIRFEYHKGINPCVGLQKYKLVSRDRFLSRDELDLFFEALSEERPVFRDFFKLALYTGARKSNLLSMRWADVDFDLKRWRIPETQTKNKDVNIVLLSSQALYVLNERFEARKKSGIFSEFVFPGDNAETYLKDPKRSFQRIRARMGVSDIRIHDLRRTLGSYMAINGSSLTVIGSALNHKSRASTEIYARLSQTPVMDAINVATAHISQRS